MKVDYLPRPVKLGEDLGLLKHIDLNKAFYRPPEAPANEAPPQRRLIILADEHDCNVLSIVWRGHVSKFKAKARLGDAKMLSLPFVGVEPIRHVLSDQTFTWTDPTSAIISFSMPVIDLKDPLWY